MRRRPAKSRNEARAADLRDVLTSADPHNAPSSKTNGNHRICYDTVREKPSYERCTDCPYNMRCVLQGEVVASWKAADVGAECVRDKQDIEFYYHDSLCLSYDTIAHRVTDHGMWGYSATTSMAIGAYLTALNTQGFLTRDEVPLLKRLFKRLHVGKSLPAHVKTSQRKNTDHPDAMWITVTSLKPPEESDA